jgi:hypothetical protein
MHQGAAIDSAHRAEVSGQPLVVISISLDTDADGVLQDEHVGDEAIEGKLKKLVAQTQQMHPAGAAGEEGKATVKYQAGKSSRFHKPGTKRTHQQKPY